MKLDCFLCTLERGDAYRFPCWRFLSSVWTDIFCCHSRSQSVPLVYEFDFNTRTGSRNSGLSTNLYDSMNIGAKIGNHLNNKHEWSHFPLTGATKADESWEINIGRKDTTLIDHMRWVSHYKFFNFVVWIWTIATTWSQLFNILIQNKASWGILRPLRKILIFIVINTERFDDTRPAASSLWVSLFWNES